MTDTRPHSPERFARYLDRVRSSYPSGIPTAAIQTPASNAQAIDGTPIVSFIALEPSESLPAEHDSLIDSIVTKGLKLALDRTARRVVTTHAELRSTLAEQAGLNGVIVILGAEQPDGRVEEIGGTSVLYSHSLTAIATEPSVKRVFWGHLQTVLGRIS